jgi:tetratricopeptide (TPR) repeat protein
MTITTRLLHAIAPAGEAVDPGRDAALGLHALGRVLELQGDSEASARAYELAQPNLRDPSLIADCLQGRARAVNQHEPKNLDRVREAISWAQSAQEMIEQNDSSDAAGRTVAMRGLLLQKLAAFESYAEQRSELLDEARALIEDAHERRLRYLEPDDPELLRSRFNFGGIEINLAKQHPQAAAEHLQNAEETYREVADARRRTYRVDVHPHIAACQSGLVLVGFYRSTLLDGNAVTRSGWLRDATDNAITAIHQREVLEGSTDGGEIVKVAQRMAKAALARSVRPGREREDAEKLFAEILSELPAPDD